MYRREEPYELKTSCTEIFLSKMNDHNGCWLNPKEIMRNLCKIIMKLRDLKPIPMIKVIYAITSIKEDV
jgi:hypothetical protein